MRDQRADGRTAVRDLPGGVLMKTGRPIDSPAAVDILGWLRMHGPAEVQEIVYRVGYSLKRSQEVMRLLHSIGVVHISAWRPCTIGGGRPAKVWNGWPGKDIPLPAPIPASTSRRESWHRTHQRHVQNYGVAIANKIMRARNNGGADQVVIDGKTVYQRRPRKQQGVNT